MPDTRQGRILDQVLDEVGLIRDVIRERVDEVPVGHSTLGDDDFTIWFEERMAQSPPALITLADGQQVVASPWVTALAFVDGGQELVNRYTRLVTRGPA